MREMGIFRIFGHVHVPQPSKRTIDNTWTRTCVCACAIVHVFDNKQQRIQSTKTMTAVNIRYHLQSINRQCHFMTILILFFFLWITIQVECHGFYCDCCHCDRPYSVVCCVERMINSFNGTQIIIEFIMCFCVRHLFLQKLFE